MSQIRLIAIRDTELSVDEVRAAVADPADPQRINPAYDSGDHLHPTDAGYEALAVVASEALSGRNQR